MSIKTSFSNLCTALKAVLSKKVDNSATGADSLLSKIDTSWVEPPDDNTYFIRQNKGTSITFGRVKFSTLWSYIKSKADTSISTTSGNYVQNKAVGMKFQGVDSEISGINATLKNKANSADVYTKTDVDNKYFMTGLRGTSLPENTDLNDITSPGVYNIINASTARTCLNTPGLLISNCRLEVFFSTGDSASNTFLIQRLYQNTVLNLYTWIRSMTTAGTWSPWHLLNGNDFTNYNYDDADVTDKYIKLATYKIPESTYIDCHMGFNIYSNMGTSINRTNNSVGALNCHIRIDTNFTTPKHIAAVWISKGTVINTDDWFVTYNATTKEFSLWKKIASKYESYNVQLISSSNRGIIGNAHNAVTMYYLKYTEDTYTAADYASIVTSTTCDSTAATKADIAKIQDRISDTGWVEVDLSNTVFENNWCDITKSKLAYKRFGDIVSFHGYFYKLESSSSLSSYSLMIKGLSKDDIVPKWMSNSNEIIDHKIIVNSSYEDISYRLCIHRDGYAEFIFKSTTDNNIDLNVGAAMIINSTYMT